jgi:hypothetical protein
MTPYSVVAILEAAILEMAAATPPCLTAVRFPPAIFAKSDQNCLYDNGFVMAKSIQFVMYS